MRSKKNIMVESLGRVACHSLPKGIVKSESEHIYHVLVCMDDFSKLCWVEVMESSKAIDATFAMMDVIMIMGQRYEISFDEILTDDASAFCGSAETLKDHPFERLLLHFGITHKIKPHMPNGKIERFLRKFDADVIEGVEYNSLDELKDSVLDYNLYCNELRPRKSLVVKNDIVAMEESEV